MKLPETVGAFVETLLHFMQIVAIVVAGVWAFFIWREYQADSRASGIVMSVETSSEWSKASNACLGFVEIRLQNKGTRARSVDHVTYRLSRSPAPVLGEHEQARVLETYPGGDSIVEGKAEGGFLITEYAPGEESVQFLPVLFKPGTAFTLWARIDAYGSPEAKEPLDYHVDDIPNCDAPTEAPVRTPN